jgi:hypothetical protein
MRRHWELAAQYGNKADRVVAQARAHSQYQTRERESSAQRAVTWARDHVFERSAVIDRRAIIESALARGMRNDVCQHPVGVRAPSADR